MTTKYLFAYQLNHTFFRIVNNSFPLPTFTFLEVLNIVAEFKMK